jgi:hypothetical protein
MRHCSILLLALLISISLLAQDSDETTHAPDGNTRERFINIIIPPVANAPFTSTVTAEWTRILEDGTTLTLQNHRLVVRDRKGRIYQERRSLVPKDGHTESQVQRIEISDPSTHLKYFCFVEDHTCHLNDYFAPTSASLPPAEFVEAGGASTSRQDLGKNIVNGLDAVGTLETTTINAGAMGNDRPISITKEFWYSPQLGLNLSVKRIDPLHGTQIFNVTGNRPRRSGPQVFLTSGGIHRRRPSHQNKAGSHEAMKPPRGPRVSPVDNLSPFVAP